MTFWWYSPRYVTPYSASNSASILLHHGSESASTPSRSKMMERSSDTALSGICYSQIGKSTLHLRPLLDRGGEENALRISGRQKRMPVHCHEFDRQSSRHHLPFSFRNR